MKGTTREVINQKGGFLNNFFSPTIKIGRISTSSGSNRCSYSKENLWIKLDCTDNPKRRNCRYHENSRSLEELNLVIKNIIKTIEN